MRENPGVVTSIPDRETAEAAPSEKQKKKPKAPFYLMPEDAARFRYDDLYLVSEIKDELNRISSAENVKPVFGTDIFRLLAAKGYVEEKTIEKRTLQRPTPLGAAKGIVTGEKISKNGTRYPVLLYPPAVQEEIVAHYIAVGEQIGR